MKIGHVGLGAALLLLAAGSQAADRGNASASVGGRKVSIDYGRPSLKGRSLDELLKQLPEDRVWRAGENQVTILDTQGDILVGGHKVSAGRYSLYVQFGKDGSRSLLVNKDLGIPLVKLWDKAPANVANEPWPRLDGYAKNIGGQEVANAALRKEKNAAPIDTFTVSLTPAAAGATLKLAWGSESWSVDVKAGS